MEIKTKYSIKDVVYLTTDLDQKERIVIGILISPGECQYKLISGTEETWHYSLEMSKEKNLIKKLEE